MALAYPSAVLRNPILALAYASAPSRRTSRSNLLYSRASSPSRNGCRFIQYADAQ
jgi:hypothetical protein